MPIFDNKGRKQNVQDAHAGKYAELYPDAITIVERGGRQYRVKAKDYNTFLGDTSIGTAATPTPAAPTAPVDKSGYTFTEEELARLGQSESGPQGDVKSETPYDANGWLQSDSYVPKPEESPYPTNPVAFQRVVDRENAEYERRAKALEGQLASTENSVAELLRERDAQVDQANRQKDVETPWYVKLGQAKGRGLPTEALTSNGRFTDPEWRMLNAASRIVGESKELVDAAKNHRGMWRGIGRSLTDIDTWTSLMEGLDAKAIEEVANVDPEKATPAQQALLDAIAMRAAVEQQFGGDVSNWYKAGETIGNMVPLGIEMVVNPAGGFGRKAAQATLRKFAIEGTEGVAKKALKKAAVEGSKYVGSMVGGATMAGTTSLPGVAVRAKMNSIGQVQYDTDQQGNVSFAGFKEGDSYGKEFLKEYGRTAINHATEQMGAEWLSKLVGKPIGWLSKGVKKIPGAGKVANMLDNRVGAYLKNLAKDVNYNGPVEEFGEEFVAALHTAAIDGMDSLEKWFEGDNLATTGIAVTMPALLGLGASVGYGTFTGGYKAGAKENGARMRAYERAANVFSSNPNEWNEITLQLNEPSTALQEMRRIYEDETYTNEQKAAALEYAVRAMRWMAASYKAKGIASNENMDMVNGMLNDIYSQGYNAAEDEMAGIKREYDMERERALTTLGEDIVQQLDDDPVLALSLMDEARREEAMSFVNARVRYEAVIDRISDDIDERIKASDKEIDLRANKGDGMIHPAMLRGENGSPARKVYVVNGKVALFEDGTIDKANSSDFIIVRDAETGELKSASVSDFESADAAIDTETEKRTVADAIAEEYARQQAAIIEGGETAQAGDAFSFTDEEGEHYIEVLSENEDEGMAKVIFDDAEETMPIRQLNQLYSVRSAGLRRKARVTQDENSTSTQQTAASETQPVETSDSAEETATGDKVSPVEPVIDKKARRAELEAMIPVEGKKKQYTKVEPAVTAEYISLLTDDVAKQMATADKYIANIQTAQQKADPIEALEMDEQIAYWNAVKALLVPEETAAENAQPVAEAEQGVASVETAPQATNEMQETGLTKDVKTEDVNNQPEDNLEMVSIESGNDVLVDNQGNPVDADGKLIVEEVASIDEITNDDFENPTRNVKLPAIPENVANAIGTEGRPVVIKKNVFTKNSETHVELEPEDSRNILSSALYNPNLIGSTQPIKRPDYKVAIRTGEKNAVVVLDVYREKDYVEIVGWRLVNEKGLAKMQRQAEREGGQFLILSPNDGSAAALSALPFGSSSASEGTTQTADKQENSVKSEETAQKRRKPNRKSGGAGPKQVDVEGLMGALQQNGEAKLSDHVVNRSGNKLVTDERYNELKERMRKKLGGQMNIGVDPEILATGTEMAVYHIEKGARKFADFAKGMIADLGDAIRPYLKAFYNGARELPEVEEAGLAKDMTPYNEVKAFDVANFDKPTMDAMATAETVTREAEVARDVETVKAPKEYESAEGKTLRKATQEDLESNPDVYYNGEKHRILMLVHRGEQTSSGNFTKPVIERVYLENMQSVKVDDLYVEDTSENVSEIENDSVPSLQTTFNNLNDNNNGREEDSRTDNSGTQPGQKELSETEQVGTRASVEDTARDSKRKRGNTGAGRSKSGSRPQYDVNKNYTNEEIEEIVSSVTDIVDGKVVITGEVTDDIKSIVRGYKSGGVAKKGRGILDEYYTDGKIVDAVNMLIAPYFNSTTPIRVLEPSVGIGNFIEAVNNIPTSEIVAFEINDTTARIAKILYPDVDVNLRSFETEFIDESGNKRPMPQKYSLVIGNPPYGSHRGLYKGLGEESKIARYEDYFVKRSLDVLDEGGVLAMVLPSSWIDRHTKYGGYSIERAYRLPSGAFEATQVGTDIVILRKDSSVPVMERAPYFELHPERVMGEVKERKGRYGRTEAYVEGDIDAAIEAIKKENAEQLADMLGIEKNNDALNAIESAVEETGSPEKAAAVVKDAQDSEQADTKPAAKSKGKQGKYKVELDRGVETVPTSSQFSHAFSEGEIEAFADTDYEGALSNPTKHRQYANYIGGQAIHDFYYAEGDIYSKLAQLEQEKEYIIENYGAEQYEKQKALLESVLPKQKGLDEITISPNTTFVKNLQILTENGRISLKDMFVEFLRKLPRQAFGNSSSWEVIGYINNEQVHGTDKQRNQLIRERRKRVANDLFNKFLNEELSDNAKKQVVAAFNREYNSTYRPDYSKVPMFSTINRDFKGKPLKLTSVQLAGIGRMTVKGVGVLAHEVGFGKTLSGILAMHEAMTRGFAKKPLIVVPNDNILKQWVETIGEVLPNATVNTLGNLGAGYDLTDFKVNDGEFTIVTYEGLKAMSFSDETYSRLADRFSYITEDLNKHQSERDMQKEIEKRKELRGKMKRGTKPTYLFEDFGFDWLTVDEVHNANHIVSKVRLDKSVASDFRSQSQRTSDLGLKTWIAAQYIQEENNGRNVLLLSATPFTNKPLEYYSILSLVANKMLERKGFFNVDQFFATFMEADNELEIGANGRPTQKTNVRRFRNNGLFQQLLSEFIDIKGEEDNPELVRPERLNKEYKIAQNDLTAEAMAAAQELLSDNDTVLQGIGHARAAAFSPYATSLLGIQPKNHVEFVENSPKISATIKMIEQNIKDRPDAGQIIYSEVGVEFFPLIRDYLVKESGLKPNEVRIITGATSNNERANIQAAFNSGEVKVVIGSPAIKEGLNLQENTTDMYILSLPWNFTQLRQIEGRGWRQGNRWEKIRINYMLTNDSVDVFMLQRLQLKQGLYNEAMKSGAESLDVSDIDTAELKTALITDPAARAEIVTVQERAKLQQEKTQIEADLSFVMRKYEAYNKLVEKLESTKRTIKMYREWAQRGDAYWAQRAEHEEALLASIENEIEEEKQNLLKKGVNVDDIVSQTEQAQSAIAAIEAKIENLKEFQEELTQKYTEENEAKAKEQGDLISTYIKEREAENKGGFYKIRPPKNEDAAAKEDAEDGVLYRFIGEKGAANLDKAEEATTRLDNLSVAREMETAGKDARSIKLATGWERGADGKWRYETEDVKVNPDAQLFSLEKYKSNPIAGAIEAGRVDDNSTIKLTDLVDDKELFVAYPEMEEYYVSFEKMDADTKGSHSFEDKMIRINKDDIHNLESTIVHEIQHAVQHIEGFAKGGSTNARAYLYSKVPAGIPSAVDIVGEMENPTIEKVKGVLEDGDLYMYQAADLREMLNDIEQGKYTLMDVANYAKSRGVTANETYRRLAGEVESRNAQERMGYTPEQRRNELAAQTEDVSREDQIFLEENLGVSDSAEYDDVPRLNRFRVENIFGGIWIEDAEEFAKFVSAVNNYAFEENGQGVAYTDRNFYAYYLNIDGQVIPFASVALSAEESQEVVNQVNQEIKNVTKGERAQFYFDRAYVRARNAKGKNNADNGNNNGAPSSRSNGGLVRGILRKGAYYDNPGLYVKTKRADRFGIVDRQGNGPLTDRDVVMESDPYSKVLGKPRYYGKRQREFVARQRRRMADKAREIAEKLNLDNVEVLESTEGLTGKKATSKGWFDPRTGKITVVVPNHGSTGDIVETVLHEAVAHYGLRRLFGNNFENFLDNVYRNVTPEIRAEIAELAKKHGWDFHTATEEYLAGLAENTNFENVNPSLWGKIKGAFMRMLAKVGIILNEPLSDNELRYILWRSYRNMTADGNLNNVFGMAEDIAKQYELGVGNYVATVPEDTEAAEDESALLHRAGGVPGSAMEEYNRKVRRYVDGGNVKITDNVAGNLAESYLDSMHSLEVLQDAIVAETGNEIADNENAYMAENRLSSMNQAQTETYIRDYFTPMMEEVHKLVEDGEEYEDIVRYLHAKHGIERNEYMRRKQAEEAARRDTGEEPVLPNENEPDYEAKVIEKATWREELEELTESYVKKYAKRDYSGLTALTGTANAIAAEKAAQQMVNVFEREHQTGKLWRRINEATKETLKRNFVCGLIDRATYDTVSRMFNFYIPLRGWNSGVAAHEYEYLTTRQPLASPTMKTMHGRASLSDDPLATIGHMAESAIAKGNRNIMKQHFLRFVMNNPTSLATVSEQWYTYVPAENKWVPAHPTIPKDATPEQIAQIVEDFEDRMRAVERGGTATRKRSGLNIGFHATKPEEQEHIVKVMHNGKEYCVYINGSPRAAQALNGLTNPDVSDSRARKYAQEVKNFMARMFTTNNPAFIVTNLTRDVIWAGTAVMVKEDKEYVKQYTKNISGILMTFKLPSLIHKFQTGTLDMTNEVERYFNEFMLNGGETGFTQVNTVEDYKKKIKRFIEESKGDVGITKKAWNGFWDGVSFLNRSAEDITRFAVFMTSRQMGRSIAKSVWDAKEITVNFNKKGSGGWGQRYLNFLYIFFNATMQGLKNMGKLMVKHPGKMATALGAYGALGFMMPLINGAMLAMFGDDEDKDAYWNLPDWVRRNNIVIYVPWTDETFITIPLPHELRPFYGMGEAAFAALSGKQETGEALADAVLGLTEMLPIDFTANGKNFWVNMTPTIGQPIAQVLANVDYFGKPIYRENDFNELNPDWTKAYKGTSKLLVGATKGLNEITGGNNVDSGWLDLNPAVIEHYLGGYLGGTGKTAIKFFKTLAMIYDDDLRDVENVPVFSSLFQSTGERTEDRYLNERYFEETEALKEFQHSLNGYRKEIQKGNTEYEQLFEKLVNSDDFDYYQTVKGYSDVISELYSSLNNYGYSEEDKKEINDDIRSLKRKMIEELEKLSSKDEPQPEE